MDDFSITDWRLTRALDELRIVNRYLGGYTTTMAALEPFLLSKRDTSTSIRILDLGTGIADIPEYIVRWADRRRVLVEIVALDANPATVSYAARTLDRRLPRRQRERIQVVVGDALAPEFEAKAFDVVMAALFMHHLTDPEAVRLLTTMQRLARHGLIINDLHRHPLAYHAIHTIGHLLPVSPMFRNDGPVSVLRGFRREELDRLALDAGLDRYRITWHWAFRWCLTTLNSTRKA